MLNPTVNINPHGDINTNVNIYKSVNVNVNVNVNVKNKNQPNTEDNKSDKLELSPEAKKFLSENLKNLIQ